MEVCNLAIKLERRSTSDISSEQMRDICLVRIDKKLTSDSAPHVSLNSSVGRVCDW